MCSWWRYYHRLPIGYYCLMERNMELTVLDFDRLMLKHSDDLPAGENIEYQPIFEQINQARQSDDDLQLEDMWSC
ncbi:hypothetical protein [Arsenophonus endosymbiont of Aleurodicus floccissimus]|uniref:hypothetical protein n=1 Tax=Arsenophonus endosymbiont of Aleurodicus floccissimus TaxID=2152761 RepID=UPI0016003ABC|nr:hypothetical protein [Arsenophonus endosymbiont of Aleurodicus floccissimus]